MPAANCIACGSARTESIAALPSVPIVCNDLHVTAAAARAAPAGSMALRFCSDCCHFYNAGFDPALVEYSANYETALHFSDVFVEYSAQLTKTLVEQWDIRNKRVLEVGCGRGEFLNALCAEGDNTGVGFDTSYDPELVAGHSNPKVRIHSEYFDANAAIDPIDLLVCQQVLEHVPDPAQFLKNLIANPAVGDNQALVYLEVPNGLYTFESGGVWDLIYEHVSYFSQDSLLRLAGGCGCEVLDSGVTYGGQYLYLIARAGGDAQPHSSPLGDFAFISGFESRLNATLESWKERLAKADQSVGKAFVWGAGSKGITFCNVIDPYAQLGGLIDRHPNKAGKFIATSGQQVFALPSLAPGAIEQVIVMNPLYAEEIAADLSGYGNVEILIV